MDELDEAAVHFGYRPVCRLELEKKLAYLSQYGCTEEVPDTTPVDHLINPFKTVTILGIDHYPNSFTFEVRKREDEVSLRNIESLDGSINFGLVRSLYAYPVISGGLIYTGPKSVALYIQDSKQLKDVWSTHT